MVARLRHIALSVPDPEKAAEFFEKAFGMHRVGRAGFGLYVSDGTINVALLKYSENAPGYQPGMGWGVTHFGMWVDDIGAAQKQAEAAGATHYLGRADTNPDTFYEVKYKDPNGIVFDLTANGWKGAVKEVVPAADKVAAE